MRAKHAFTLIELLIVVAIIAILAAIALPNFLEAQMRSKVTRTKSDLRTLAVAWEAYRMDYNRHPVDWDSGEMGSNPYDGQGEWGTYASVTTPVAYLATVPRDIFQEGLSGTKPGDLYEYWGMAYANSDFVAWNRTGTYWLMYSLGPDRRGDVQIASGKALDYAGFAYDSTNGSVSAGDVGRTNVLDFPQ